MKLAEVLLLRGDLQRDLAWAKGQLAKDARVQEGDEPGEPPSALIERIESLTAKLETLITRINEANLAHRDSRGQTLTQLMAHRDMLRLKHATYAAAHAEATNRESHYGASEIKWKPAFDAAEMRKRVEAISIDLRELNAKVQQLNWSIDIGDI